MPWIHLADQIGSILYSIDNEALSGPVNAAAPNPVTNREFVRSLARALHRPAFLPVPAFALKLILGEMSEIVMGSQRVLPKALDRAGYQFRFPVLDSALADLLQSGSGVVE